MNTGIDEMIKQRDDQLQNVKDMQEAQKNAELRYIKLEAFKLAVQIKPQHLSHEAEDLIKDAELIYQSLLNK